MSGETRDPRKKLSPGELLRYGDFVNPGEETPPPPPPPREDYTLASLLAAARWSEVFSRGPSGAAPEATPAASGEPAPASAASGAVPEGESREPAPAAEEKTAAGSSGEPQPAAEEKAAPGSSGEPAPAAEEKPASGSPREPAPEEKPRKIPMGPAPEEEDGKRPGRKSPGKRINFPLAAKLVLIITLLLLLSLGAITALVWTMIHADQEATAERTNRDINARAALAAEDTLATVTSHVALLLQDFQGGPETAAFFAEHPGIGAIALPDTGEILLNDEFFVSESFFVSHEIDPALVPLYLADTREALQEDTVVLNGAPFFGKAPVLVLRFPLETGGHAVVFFSSEDLTSSFGAGANGSYMINRSGELLVHPDQELIAYGASPETPGTDRAFVASTTLSFGGVQVITSIDREVVFEAITATTRRNLYLSLAAWFFGVLACYFLARTVSRPLGELREAAARIEDGHYHIDLTCRNRDETGLLTESVVSMSHVLGNFEKLTNKTIARLARLGRLAVGGADREATFFFSDIRSFTAISEKMRPDEVVEFLNDYMDRMVACVLLTGGAIDKFIGDAVMAHWGAVEPSGDRERDALNGVRAALLMRASLASFNVGRGGDKRPLIRIGCGLNSGRVVAGQIGSSERLEYTVIGDAVSLADRTETFNKPFATEILITEHTWRLVGKYLITEAMPPILDQGKRVGLYAVVNMRAGAECDRLMADLEKLPKINLDVARRCVGPSGPQTLTTLRRLLGKETPDLSQVNLDEDEKKYVIAAPPAAR